MKNSPILKSRGATPQKKQVSSAIMKRLRAAYLSIGVTEQEFIAVQDAAHDLAKLAAVLAVIRARLEVGGHLKPNGVQQAENQNAF